MTSLGTAYEAEGLAIPDTLLLPTQLGTAGRPPEGRLWAEVLRLAVLDIDLSKPLVGVSCTSRAAREGYRTRARAWLDSPSIEVGSCRWACEHLALDPAALQGKDDAEGA